MKYMLPQEIQVWYILPVIRRELSRILVKEKGLTQKDTAKTLAITEGAVSQYLSSKRGNAVTFNEHIINEIRLSADQIMKNSSLILYETVRILNLDQVWDIVCEYHKKNDTTIKGECNICTQYREKSDPDNITSCDVKCQKK